MSIRKYFSDNSEAATFRWKLTNVAFRYSEICKCYSNTGLIRINAVGVLNNVVLYDITTITTGLTFVNTNAITAPTNVCDEIIVTITFLAPETISRLYISESHFDSSYKYYCFDTSGIQFLSNCQTFDVYYYDAYIPLAEELFLCRSLTKIECGKFNNIKKIDARLAGLPNLEILNIGFTEYEQLNTNVLLSMPVLNSFDYRTRSSDLTPINDSFMIFSSAFTSFTQLKTLKITYGLYINIPDSIKYLNLETFVLLYTELNATNVNLMEFPLLSGADNTNLTSLSFIGNNDNVRHLEFPNISKLTVLSQIIMNVLFGANDTRKIEQIEYFYELFYSEIYNETNVANNGYAVSDVSRSSGYFSTLTTPPSGFIHPTLRYWSFSDNYTSVKDDVAVASKITEIRATGFTMTGNQLI